jgi:hypothetical protein
MCLHRNGNQMSDYRAPGAEAYAKKIVETDSPRSDWVNIAYDYSQGYLAALKAIQANKDTPVDERSRQLVAGTAQAEGGEGQTAFENIAGQPSPSVASKDTCAGCGVEEGEEHHFSNCTGTQAQTATYSEAPNGTAVAMPTYPTDKPIRYCKFCRVEWSSQTWTCMNCNSSTLTGPMSANELSFDKERNDWLWEFIRAELGPSAAGWLHERAPEALAAMRKRLASKAPAVTQEKYYPRGNKIDEAFDRFFNQPEIRDMWRDELYMGIARKAFRTAVEWGNTCEPADVTRPAEQTGYASWVCMTHGKDRARCGPYCPYVASDVREGEKPNG